jgi:predicted transcriptional regulator
MTNTAKKSKIKDLDEDQQAIYKLIMGCHGFLPTWTQISQTLQMSKQRIGAAMWELEACGLLDHAKPELTDDQRHVLYTLPPKEDSRSVTYEELAEQVGMDVQTVEECMRVLDEKGWICDPDETREEG